MNVNVKTMLKLGAVTVLLMVAGAAKSHAATTNQIIDKIAIDLTYYEQGPTNSTNGLSFVEKTRVKNSDIIATLGAATSNSFSAFARLVLVTDTTSSNSTSHVEIIDGTNTVDVSSYFTSSNSTLSVSGAFSPRGWEGEDNSRHHRNVSVNGTIVYDILYLKFGGANTKASFNADGLEITTSVNNTNSVAAGLNQSSALLSGTGTDTNGTPAIVSGTFSITAANPNSEDSNDDSQGNEND